MVLRQSAVYLVAKAVPGLVNFLSTFLFSRLVAPGDYGVFAAIFAGVMMANTIAQVWLRTSLVRLYPEFLDDPKPLLGTVQWVDRASNVAALAIGVLGLLYFRSAPESWYWLAGVFLFILQSSQEIGLELERATLQSKRFAVNSSLRAVLRLVATVGFLLLGWGVWGLLLGAAVGALAPNLYAWWGTWRHIPARLDREILRRLLAYGVPLIAVYALDMAIFQLSRIFLTSYKGVEVNGVYSMVLDLLKQCVTIVPLGVNLAVFPLALRRYKEGDHEGARATLRRGLAMTLALSVPMTALFVFEATSVANVVFGAKYREAAPSLMPAIALASWVSAIKVFYFDLAFQFGFKTGRQFLINAAGAVVSVVGCLATIQTYGAVGVAWANFAGYVAASVVSIFQGRKVHAMPWDWRSFGVVAAATTAMVLAARAAHGVSNSPWAAFGAAAVVYPAILLATDYLGLRGKILRRVRR